MNWIKIMMISLVLVGCTKNSLQNCSTSGCLVNTVSYKDDIAPLIEQSCATNQGPGTGCHDAWIFEYDNVKSRADNGSLLSVILDGSMPKIPNNFGIQPLTDDEIFKFECWVCNGAPNN